MGTIPDEQPVSLKEQIVKNAMARLRDLVRIDDGEQIFLTIKRGDPNDEEELQANLAPYAFVEETDDSVANAQMYTGMVYNREITLIVHFRFVSNTRDVDPYEQFNYYVAKTQGVFLDGTRFNGTVMDIDEVQNTPEVFVNDHMQGGHIIFRARYRHKRDNPYERV